MRTTKSYALWLILIFFLFTSLTLSIQTTNQPLNQLQYQPPTSCTLDQITIAKNAIDTCEPNITDITALLKCISSEITKKSGQYWNIFMKNTAQNSDVVMYWTSDNCSVNLESYGKFGRNYVMWPSESYANIGLKKGEKVKSTRMNHYLELNAQTGEKHIRTQHNPTQSPSVNDLTFTCPDWKINQALNILTACDISGNNRAAQCIISRIRDQLSQKWGVLVAVSIQSNLNWYSFNGCSKQVSFGAYGRRIYLWKATEL